VPGADPRAALSHPVQADKNAPEYKAVVEASRRSGRAPLDLLKAAGAIDSPYEFHWRRFLFEEFPKGVGFGDAPVPSVGEKLALSPAAAFSIDDSSTTEIDDALSVQGPRHRPGHARHPHRRAGARGRAGLGGGADRARPPLDGLHPRPQADHAARRRRRRVHARRGRDAAVVSLYLTIDEATLATLASETRLERVRIAANLRHDVLEDEINEETLAAGLPPSLPFAAELTFLHGLAQHLKAGREKVRGKPENFNRPDYSFKLDLVPAAPSSATSASRSCRAARLAARPHRRRGDDPRQQHLGRLARRLRRARHLPQPGEPGAGREGADEHAAGPHAGIGVAQYAWSTSPLRRYVDLVNQWQIVACARAGRSAALIAPFKPKDVQLLATIADFDASYAAYNAFQSQVERYWSLRYLMQNDLHELDAAVMKDGLVRADTLPLVFRAVGAEQLGRGTGVRVRIGAIDLLTLDVAASVDRAPRRRGGERR
jgi:exoribonuclease-2